MAIWIKNRRKLVYRFGATHEQYKKYQESNRESFGFSLKTSGLFLIFALVDIFTGLLVFVIAGLVTKNTTISQQFVTALELGECGGLILAIPLVLLYSYKKPNKRVASYN